MIIELKNNKQLSVRRLKGTDYDQLTYYLYQLSPETKKRFGPHPFDKAAVSHFYQTNPYNLGYIAEDSSEGSIVAYAVVRLGYLEHDADRLRSFGFVPDHFTDVTYAPSVADHWQGLGTGYHLLQFIEEELKTMGRQRIILWGGVQQENETAVRYYLKNGFVVLGAFEYNGPNYDMAKTIG
ncbi:MAG: GNAT family N-acetyltransferase [Chitinophagales bacterium]|nr:GNAT family N-acetyltransferase [Chitinophagales bacterium]